MRFLVFVMLLMGINLCAQNKVKDTVTYREYSTLKWKDFKAPAPKNTDYSASVNTGISYKWSYSTARGIVDFKYDIEARLYRNFSWSIYEKDKENVLKHEQLHFDITELFARKFRKALAEYTVGRSIRKDVSKIYEKIETERTTMQLLYDKETGHSINKTSQLSWENKIKDLLQEYQTYK